MSSVLNSLLTSLLGGGVVHDYAHAAQVFRTNNYARAPRYKFLYTVNFVLSSDAPAYVSTRELSYLVKNIDLPKFNIDVREMNQYNRKAYVQTKIRYEPINIRLHDDNQGSLRELWDNYYTYYFADGTYTNNDYNYDDRYRERRNSAWGLDNGETLPFFSALEIYSLAGGTSNKITLLNPVIRNFSYDNHDHAEGQGIMEATMQIHYNGVIHESGYVAGTPNFAVNQAYDPTLSGISGGLAGLFFDSDSNNLIVQPTDFSSAVQERAATQYALNLINQVTAYNPSSSNNLSSREIASIVDNNSRSKSSQLYSFPVADINGTVRTENSSEIIPYVSGSVASSNGSLVPTPQENATLYPKDSYQQILYNQGYNTDQISAASKFVDSISSSTLTNNKISNGGITATQAFIAQKYIDNPKSVSDLADVNYGQAVSIPTSINFSNPSNPVNPIYNSQTWQQILSSQGYTTSQINIAANQISQLNVAPETDLVPIAKKYIDFNSKNNNT